MSRIELRHVSKIFPDGTPALQDLTLTAEDGELLVLVGPSGCGKSTALRLIAGLDSPTRGEILADGELLNHRSPQQRNVAMVFQNYALYPHKTIRKNLEFPLRMMKMPKGDINRRVLEASRLLGMDEYLDRKPAELSGGQQQRAAMGRAIVRNPRVFLMDEPLSNLDAKLRVEIRTEIAALQERLGITTIYVTHDQVEAMTLGHRVAVLHKGTLQQIAPAQEVYERPANLFVATFMGSPSMNLVRTSIQSHQDKTTLKSGSCEWDLPEQLAQKIRTVMPNKSIILGIRPESFLTTPPSSAAIQTQLEVRSLEALGHEIIAYGNCDLEACSLEELDITGQGYKNAEADRHTERICVRLPARPIPTQGERLSLFADPMRCHYFSPHGNRLDIPANSD